MEKWANDPQIVPRHPNIKSYRIKLKFGTDTNSSTSIPKMIIPKLENNGKRVKIPQNRSQPPNIQSGQIKLKVGIDTKTDMGSSKTTVLKSKKPHPSLRLSK